MSDTTLANMAERLIERRGRSMTLRQLAATGVPSGGNAWDGYTKTTTNTTVNCVMVPLERITAPEDRYQDKNVVREQMMRALIAGSETVSDVKPGDLLIDGSATWTVLKVNHYDPGSVSILFDCEVGR